MALTTDFYLIVGSYLLIIFGAIAGIQFAQRGFFTVWLRVKASREKKVLVQVITANGDYFVIGTANEGFLQFKDRTKEKRLLACPKEAIFRAYAVWVVQVDDKKNTVLDRSKFEMVNGYDGKLYDAYYERILSRPTVNNKMLVVIVVLVSVIILLSLVNIYYSYKIYQLIGELGKVAAQAQTITPTG